MEALLLDLSVILPLGILLLLLVVISPLTQIWEPRQSLSHCPLQIIPHTVHYHMWLPWDSGRGLDSNEWLRKWGPEPHQGVCLGLYPGEPMHAVTQATSSLGTFL